MKKHRNLRRKKRRKEKGVVFTEEDRSLLEKMKDLLLVFQEKYGLSNEQISQMLTEELFFPNTILAKNLTPLHSVVKYLKENKLYTYSKIASLIGRDQRNVWRIYNDSKKNHPASFQEGSVKIWIPVGVISQSKLSAQESLVKYLKEVLDLSHHTIAVLLHRDDRTIWTVYNRAKKKDRGPTNFFVESHEKD